MFVRVDVLSQFKMSYVVELKDGDPLEYALDTVAMEEDTLKEFCQEHLGTTIFGATEVKKEELAEMARKDNPYLSQWTDEKLIEVLVNTIKEEDGRV